MHITGAGCTYEEMKNAKNEKNINHDGADKLTGLYNGEYTNKQTELYINKHKGSKFALYVMDIDNFKAVDDNLGRLFGNEIIKEIADNIVHMFGSQDVVGRIGGDQFLVCQKDYGSLSQVEKYASDLCSKTRNVYAGENQDYMTSLSIGIALCPEHGTDSQVLFQNAKKALAHVKYHGKDGYEIYDPSMAELEVDSRNTKPLESIYIYQERGEVDTKRFDSFGYELVDLAFSLMEESRDVKNTINLLIRKVGVHYNLSAVAVRELINKPRTLRYMYEYVSSRAVPNRQDSEWQYARNEWKVFQSHFKDGYYLYYQSEGIPFDILEIESRDFRYKTFLEIPIINNGQIVGCMDFVSLDKEVHYSRQDISTLKMFTKVISSYLLNMRNYYNTTLKVEELNDYDALTGLMKYSVFQKKVKNSLKRVRRNNNVLISYSDLRHFKYINETYGYDVGNKLLKMFCSKTIRDVKGFIGSARVYSDNIVMAAEYPAWFTDEQVYAAISEKNSEMNRELQDTFMDNNISVCTGLFIIKNPKIDIEIAISNANMARKEAKKKERNPVVLFDDEMMQSVVRQMQLNAELPGALRNRNIKVYYQPKTESGTGKIVGAEALVRWQKDDGQFIYPDEFIPGFEENGMIVEIDYYVYENVFIKIQERIDAGLPVVPISMNISSVHLKEGEFLDYIEYLFDKYPIPSQYVEFELTESIYIENLEKALELIHGLRERGIKISMDDFGSGYSSLNLLNNLPIDILKLDKIFLNGDDLTINQKIIISCIIEMASKLNIRVVCEGVETSEQANFLTVIGCDMIQGYYYAKPLPEAEFSLYMDQHIKVNPSVVFFPFDKNLEDSTGRLTGYCMGGNPEFGKGPFHESGALQFRGREAIGRIVNLPVEIYTNSSYTISCWIKVKRESLWSSAIFMEFENGFNSIMPNAGDLKADFRIKLMGEKEDIWHDTGSEITPDGEWHFYAATYNAQTKVAILYLDGVIAGYMENVEMLSGIRRILVGGDAYAAPFCGLISRLRIYNQSLSKTDIGCLYAEDEKKLETDKDEKKARYR